jgi:hypothetical protein
MLARGNGEGWKVTRLVLSNKRAPWIELQGNAVILYFAFIS